MASSLMTERPQAVFWDMDGTLIDTEPFWFAAEKRLVHSFGGVWSDEDCHSLVGLHLPAGARLLQAAGVGLSVDEIVAALVNDVRDQAMANLILRPGAIELLSECAQAGIPQALVTMSEDPLVSSVIAALEERAGATLFQVVVTGDQVVNGKPDPQAYLLAQRKVAELIEAPLRGQRCIVIEDSPVGVGAGENSGMVTIAVPHTLPITPSERHHRWETLAGKTVMDLARLTAQDAIVGSGAG